MTGRKEKKIAGTKKDREQGCIDIRAGAQVCTSFDDFDS